MKNFIITLLVIILVGFGIYFLTKGSPSDVNTLAPTENNEQIDEIVVENKESTVIGKSVEGRDITAYHYGNGDEDILFVGGVHGGYSWNTTLVAYETMDYLKANPSYSGQSPVLQCQLLIEYPLFFVQCAALHNAYL